MACGTQEKRISFHKKLFMLHLASQDNGQVVAVQPQGACPFLFMISVCMAAPIRDCRSLSERFGSVRKRDLQTSLKPAFLFAPRYDLPRSPWRSFGFFLAVMLSGLVCQLPCARPVHILPSRSLTVGSCRRMPDRKTSSP